MTHTGSILLKSTGFNIGDRIAIALMLWKHLSSNGIHWKIQLFCADPDNGVVYTFKSFLLGSQDLKVNLCGLQQDIRSDGKK